MARPTRTTRALVLGGGGVAGIAWEIGVLAGLAEAGVDVTGADRVVGTSAGSVVGAQLCAGLPMADLLARQTDPARQAAELPPGATRLSEVAVRWMEIHRQAADPADRRRRMGALALAVPTVDEAGRRRVMLSRLPVHTWPDRDLVVVAVDAATGEPLLLGPRSGVDLVDAVAASCAVPGVWPPVTLGHRRCIDGGVRSLTNADLAAGHDRVLVLAPMVDPGLEEELRALGTARAEVIRPDGPSLVAIGTDPLDPRVRVPCARAGLAQGAAVAERVAALWG